MLGFIASLVSSVFGFGSAILVLAIAPHFLPIGEAIALAAVLFGASTLVKSLLFRQHLDWRVVGIMAIASIPFAYLGGRILPALDPELARRLLGLMILTYLLIRLVPLPSVRIGTAGLMIGSALYGFLSGLLGTGSVIKVVIFREMNISREAFVGAMAATSVLASGAKILAYIQAGLLDRALLWPSAGLIVAATAAALIGRRFLGRISLAHFDWGVRALLAVAAIAMVL